MRLYAFQHAGSRTRLGALVGTDLVDLARACRDEATFADLHALMAAGERGLDAARAALEAARRDDALRIPLAAVRLRPPLGRPTLLRDFSTMDAHMRNYLLMRARERSRTMPDPEAYIAAERAAGRLDMQPNWLSVHPHHVCNPLNTIGPDDPLHWPVGVRELDYELELAVVIGRAATDVGEARAREHIFGYTLMNDFTARDIQRAEAKATGKSKDFNGSYSLGPCVVTRDEVDVYALGVRARLNGELQSEDHSSRMKIRFEQLIAYMSRNCTLHAGEVFASGTFERGCGLETGRLLRPGDVVELEADGIGTLRNPVLGPPAAHA